MIRYRPSLVENPARPGDGPGEETIEGTAASYWLETTPETSYEALDGDGETLSVDTAVVGGGIAGLTTAVNLAEEGQSVALVERDRVVTGVTGHTSAKLTSLHGLVYDRLLDTFGATRARRYADANEAAIDAIEERVESFDVDCEFERTPAYTYTESQADLEDVRNEVRAAQRLGLPASFTESTPLPYEVAGAVRFDDQARFDPRTYLLALADRLAGDGNHLFEQTRVTDVDDGEPCRVETDRGSLTATDVVIATHFPVVDHALYFARMEPKRSYVVAARLSGEPPEGMFYQPSDPYFSVRPRPGDDDDLVLVGGQTHRPGEGGSTAERYRRLESGARERFDVESIEYRWSTQDFTTLDGVPFVGRHSRGADHVYVATGFGGWGMTGGTAAGTLLADLILGRENPWRELYRPNRFEFGASKERLVSHNKHAMKQYVEDYVTDRPMDDRVRLEPGQATVTGSPDGPVGVYCDESGEYHTVSAVCSHLGCLVEWNDGEESWDCPCHGSRFDVDGTVLDAPATDDLPQREYPPRDERR